MADSFVRYTANGSTDTFSIPFGYLDPSHVSVTVDGSSEAFTFPTSSQVQITSGNPTNGAIVEVRRTTPRDSRQVVWANAANLTASDLNTSDLQFLYITQEAFDLANDALLKDSDGIFDATSIRIQNVATPTATGDAVNKTYVDTQLAANVSTITALTDEAEEWASKTDGIVEATDYSAKAYAIGGTGVTDTAGRGAAKEWATAAEDDTVDGTEYSAKHYSIKAAASASAASTSETNAGTSETNAATSETNAAASAAAAASSAAEGLYNDVITITNADSPYVPSLAQEGTLFRCDTSSGNIVVNLSELSTYGEDMKFAFVKTTGDGNTITVNRGGSDTIDGTTSEVISDQYVVTVLVGDSASGTWISVVQSSGVADGAITTAKLADDAVTLDKMAGGTDGNLITFDASGNPAYVATGTTGQVLTSNGAGAAPTMQDAAGGSLVLLSTATASASSSVDFTSDIDSTYEEYLISLIDVVAASDSNTFYMRTSTDGGSSFDSSGYRYALGKNNDGSGAISTIVSGSAAQILISEANRVGSAAGESFNGFVRIYKPSGTNKTIFQINSCYAQNTGQVETVYGTAMRDSAADVDAIRFLMASGNITSGEFKLYGVKKS